jgi:hypothetical protein
MMSRTIWIDALFALFFLLGCLTFAGMTTEPLANGLHTGIEKLAVETAALETPPQAHDIARR